MTVAVCEPVQVLVDGLEGLRGSLAGLDDKAVVQALREVEVLHRQTQSVMLDLVAEIDARGIAAREGVGPTQRLLAGMLRLSLTEARMRRDHAGMVGTRHTLTGAPLPLRLPETAAALAAGDIGTGQLKVITETTELLPASVPDSARDCDPRRLRIIARRVPERQADARIELCQRARATEEVPTTAGEPPHVTVTLEWDALRTGVKV